MPTHASKRNKTSPWSVLFLLRSASLQLVPASEGPPAPERSTHASIRRSAERSIKPPYHDFCEVLARDDKSSIASRAKERLLILCHDDPHVVRIN